MTLDKASSKKVLRVGLIGCGDVAQVVHIPTLNFLTDLFRITYLCDVSEAALKHCQQKIVGGILPQITTEAKDLCSSSDVDVVFVINSDEYHAEHAILALQQDKFVFVEKPLTLNIRDAEEISRAEELSRGDVMVGYMRRYAPAFIDAVKEIGGMEEIIYARVRDIIGPNSTFIEQSGTFPKKFTDIPSECAKDMELRGEEATSQGLRECWVPKTPGSVSMWRLLGSLGSHDLSAMREALGMPVSVLGAHLGLPLWGALLQYPNFVVNYESGIHNVPIFDAHIEVYSKNKQVRVEYDTPFVKGLPITMHVGEVVEGGAYKEVTTRRTYEDAYTAEMKELYAHVVEGKPIKTTIEDAIEDLEVFGMIMHAGQVKK